MPYMKVRNGKDDKPVCIYKKGADDKPEGESLGCHENEEKADKQMAALHAREKEMTQFLFTELTTAALTPGRAFDGLAPSGDVPFTAMGGQTVIVKPEELQAYLKNTLAAIAATKSESGEIVGLPIDCQKHDKGSAAGWIIGAEQVGNLVRLIPKWTGLGVELISKNIQRFFSPTLDTITKTIRGGSLTNWPASLSAEGHPLLRPVELSQQLYRLQEDSLDERSMKIRQAFNMAYMHPQEEPWVLEVFDDHVICRAGEGVYRVPFTMENEEIKFAERAAWVEVKPAYVEAAKSWFSSLLKRLTFGAKSDEGVFEMQITEAQLQKMIADGVAAALKKPEADKAAAPPVDLAQFEKAIGERAELAFRAQLVTMQRENQTAELAQQLTGGTPQTPRGLKGVTAADLQKHLLAIPQAEAEFFAGLLTGVVKGEALVEFTELGHERHLTAKQPVPDYAAKSLRDALAAGSTVEKFFELAGIGAATDFDLAPFQTPAKGA